MDRVEDAGEERKRNDDEILEYRQLVELVGPHAGQQAERTQDGAAEQRKRSGPQRVRHQEQRWHEEERYDEYAESDDEAAHHRAQYVRRIKVAGRQWRQQHEDQVAGDLRLDQRR